MNTVLRRPYSWTSLLAILFLAFGMAQFAACSGGDDDDVTPGDDDTTVTSPTPETQATPTPETQATPTPETQATPTPEPAKVNITFTVDLNIDADNNPDTNLNEVKEGEDVFIVGNFNEWNPNDPEYAMSDNGDNTWSITVPFPVGTTIYFKFAKTSSDPNNPWAEGEKDYRTTEDEGWKPCEGHSEVTEGLFEVDNREYAVPETDDVLESFPIDAWRDTAEAYGLYSCD